VWCTQSHFCDQSFFLHAQALAMLVPWFGRSSAALKHKLSAIDLTVKTSSFSQICSLSPILPKMHPFLPKTNKTKKTQKESKIA
jgi:hypothetical protein